MSSETTPKKEKIDEAKKSSSIDVTSATTGYYRVRTKTYRTLMWASSIEEARKKVAERGEEVTNDAGDRFVGPDQSLLDFNSL